MDFKWKEEMEISCDKDGILEESFAKYPEWGKKKNSEVRKIVEIERNTIKI